MKFLPKSLLAKINPKAECAESLSKTPVDNRTHPIRRESVSSIIKFLFRTKRSVQICGASCLTNRILIKGQIWRSFVFSSLAGSSWSSLSVLSNLINPTARYSHKPQNLLTRAVVRFSPIFCCWNLSVAFTKMCFEKYFVKE